MKVELLIIGAARSGTTTIFEYLKQHKQVCFSKIKEIHYFSIDDLYQRGEDYYHSFFKASNQTKIFASADTYLFVAPEKIIERIKKYNPLMKFIVMLRDPVDRAFSGYLYAINNGYLSEKVSFRQAIENEQEILQTDDLPAINNLCNVYQSLYYLHIKRWVKFFPKENFLFLQTKHLKTDLANLLSEIANFLDIDDFEETEQIVANSAKAVKSKKIEQILLNRQNPVRKLARKIMPYSLKQKILGSGIVDKLHSLNKSNKVAVRRITDEEREFALNFLRDDMKKLQQEFGISL